ncbi:LysM peptidoglycan-binding domain-containing protein [Spiribacter sp. 218]|jgi:membrane-bound lytic murein transglycosylase D|uniref:lytic transglycosylase domain-containing protein n=1 Tax=Spiribacter pallidus TaxID=1987936 RepID=UPI00349F6526
MITLQRWILLVACLLLASPGTAADRLPRPEGLAPAIDFWVHIYTEVPVDAGVIHDAAHPLRRYGRVAVAAPPEWRARREQVRDALARYRQAFADLADHNGQPRTPLQRRIAARLPADAGAAEIARIGERLRFQGGLRERFRNSLIRAGRWRAYIADVLAAEGVPAELVALPHVESSFNPRARSHAGAAGLWQFTAGTGREYMRVDPVVDERLDPWASTRAAAALLADNHEKLGHWPLAITAYNHGAAGVKRGVEAVGETDYMALYHRYEGPRFGFASRNFYPALLAAARVDRRPGAYFANLQPDPAVEPVRMALPHFTPVSVLLAELPVDEATLQRLNPGLGPSVWDGRKFIPRGHRLALPADGVDDWRLAIAALPGSGLYREQRPDVTHRIAAGDTLSAIAARYQVAMADLMRHNGIDHPDRIRAGQQLELPVAGGMPAPVGGQHYRVQPGDTLGEIARRHDLRTDQLASLNQLDDPDRLQVGQRLLVDAAAVAAVDIEQTP